LNFFDYGATVWAKGEPRRRRLQQNTPAAASILLKLMVDPATPASGRIRAALGTFALAREALDLDIVLSAGPRRDWAWSQVVGV